MAAYSVKLICALGSASGHVPVFKAWLCSRAILTNVWLACLMSDSVLSLSEKLPRIRRSVFWSISLATFVHYGIVLFNLPVREMGLVGLRETAKTGMTRDKGLNGGFVPKLSRSSYKCCSMAKLKLK